MQLRWGSLYVVHYRAIAACPALLSGCWVRNSFSSRVQYVLSKYKRADVFAAGVLEGKRRRKKAKVLHSTAGSSNGRIGNCRSNIVADTWGRTWRNLRQRTARECQSIFKGKGGESSSFKQNSKCAEKNYCLDKVLDVNQRRRRAYARKIFFFVKLVSFFSLPSNWSTERPGKSFKLGHQSTTVQ